MNDSGVNAMKELVEVGRLMHFLPEDGRDEHRENHKEEFAHSRMLDGERPIRVYNLMTMFLR